ncbi:SURF1 family protein [Branchiibius sp. NY16-3462-2]|uniref:SURF1 family cytochrome oxidase biogenesis protein n=1 Tax=Branchiibius sp. NY16-3462-2 TaxID=1807500 RepID=UPI0007927FA4|nr:SURF1 family protein [Branchiibius sp. NY16-3462-2]KYH44410.1 hypothetical protein AZH51_07740 [Branchiibius sp. NY16-3462-2]
MLAKLTERRWLTWLLVATVWAVGCFFLGLWQWHRFSDKHTAQEQLHVNYDATPVPLADAVGSGRNWLRVTMTGTYVADQQVLARNRPNDGDYGYEVLVPLRLTAPADGASTVIVDRGWVPNGKTASAPDSVPAVPSGQVTVVGWLRPFEPNLTKPPVPGQVASIYLPDIVAAAGLSPTDVVSSNFVLMQSERTASGASPARPASLPEPDPGSYAGINLSYAIQWWIGMVAGYAFVIMRARRELRDERAGTPRGGAAPRPAKPKKVRIWDEEDA